MKLSEALEIFLEVQRMKGMKRELAKLEQDIKLLKMLGE